MSTAALAAEQLLSDPAALTGSGVPADLTESGAAQPADLTESGEAAPLPADLTESGAAALPCGFAGLPAGYVLSKQELADKAALTEHGVPAQVAVLTAGTDYIAGEVMALAPTRQYAELVAAAYSGALASYGDGVAVVTLPAAATVPQAVAAAADLTLPLPAVSPNYITPAPEPISEPEQVYRSFSAAAEGLEAPTLKSWQVWVNEALTHPDPFIANPASSRYQWMHDMVNTYEAWGVTTGSPAVRVAVIDTGVNAGHPELMGRVFPEDIGLGTADDNGHGTHCAGIIAAALDNGAGGAGIAPGVGIISIRVLGADGTGSDSNIIRGINRAVAVRADIISMSLGGYYYNPAADAAIQNAAAAGITVVAAMGNDGGNVVCYPAAYDNVIAVAAVGSSGLVASYSDYGPWADIAAPGSNIWSTASDGTYVEMSGTSMATPVVAGVAALYMSAVGHVPPAVMEKVLKSSVNKSSSSQIGAGIVDASKLFAGDKTAPAITVLNPGGQTVTDLRTAVPYGSRVTIAPVSANGEMVVYTTDGKTPAVRDGVVVAGEKYTGAIDLSSFPVNKSITIKAACISGMGVLSNVASVTLKMDLNSAVGGVTVTAPQRVVAGRSVTLTAAVAAAAGATEAVSQKVTWSIAGYTGGLTGATISSAGLLRTAAKLEGTVTVRAASVQDPTKYATADIAVEAVNPVAIMKLNYSRYTLAYSSQREAPTVALSADTLLDAAKNPVDPSRTTLLWSSSNVRVATVSSTGLVTAVGKGSATVTCRAMDGSGKSAACSVSVLQLAESVSVTGQLSIAPGASAAYSAAVLPTTGSRRAVVWSLQGAVPAGVTISTSGTVRVPAGVTEGTFRVTATARDGGGAAAEQTVQILPKATFVAIPAQDSRCTSDRNGWVTAAQIYTVDLPGTALAENVLQLTASTDDRTDLLWTSANPKVAAVDQSGKVTAVAAGSARITCAAQDGSGRKATATVKVIVPCSGVTVVPRTTGQRYIGLGKSAANVATLRDSYGKPTVTRVTWSLVVRRYTDDSSYSDITDSAVSSRLVSISSSGTISVSARAASLMGSGDLVAFAVATSTDGTKYYGSFGFDIVPAATYIRLDSTTVSMSETDNFENIEFYSDCYGSYTATSSNPQAVSAIYAGALYDDNNVYQGDFCQLAANKNGTARITIRANDGSGRSCSFTVKVTGFTS